MFLYVIYLSLSLNMLYLKILDKTYNILKKYCSFAILILTY
ncbi:hypothetical protein CCAND38_180062 [Capnocytophaga canis]|uniref:Uncharacterized protein n=1 Tax=Capnocytophaga canis TaxID=1848903 RepID=A0A0B7IM01_9FLAO|nr:hypothetical protein CCAND38_180062 [Capnocytophaga canis]CEN52885.1 hypothetical protein CCAND93_320002 [Capnocytophaga canis]